MGPEPADVTEVEDRTGTEPRSPLRVTVTESPDEFATRAGELLASRVEHNLLATVLDVGRRASDRLLCAWVESDTGPVIAAALRLPPHRLLATVMDGAAARALIDAWLEHDPALPGVGARLDVARELAREWQQRTGGRVELVMAEAL